MSKKTTKPKHDQKPAPVAAQAPAPRGQSLTIDAYCLRKGRTELVQAFAHVERLSHARTRKFAAPEWDRLFAEFRSAPRG